ncbi:hypothetical protein GCM10010466_03490 [Planomonospora alba]|uniref:Uncharacterized protein n=1 Tax=Planomonospora alba TaxID=161354 RepID=A0ABP6MIN5_9ACTN
MAHPQPGAPTTVARDGPNRHACTRIRSRITESADRPQIVPPAPPAHPDPMEGTRSPPDRDRPGR